MEQVLLRTEGMEAAAADGVRRTRRLVLGLKWGRIKRLPPLGRRVIHSPVQPCALPKPVEKAVLQCLAPSPFDQIAGHVLSQSPCVRLRRAHVAHRRRRRLCQGLPQCYGKHLKQRLFHAGLRWPRPWPVCSARPRPTSRRDGASGGGDVRIMELPPLNRTGRVFD